MKDKGDFIFEMLKKKIWANFQSGIRDGKILTASLFFVYFQIRDCKARPKGPPGGTACS
jgi:hypothetical protein